jgi:hypothetical protein
VHVERPTPACGNEIDLQRLDSERDPFQVSEQLKAETDRLYPEATLTPWLDRD